MDEDESRSVLTARRPGGMTRVLVVEDEQDIADLVKHALVPLSSSQRAARKLTA